MAVPLQYQSQFVPTDFNTLGNVLGMFRQDMQQRNQQFDQGVAAEQMALAQLSELDTYDPAKKQELITSLQQRIKDVVDKRGGDYGAAASDITGIIAKEKSNPWYQFDKSKLAATKEEAKLKQLWGPDYYSDKDIAKTKLEDWLANPESLTSTATNLKPYREIIGKLGKAEADLKTETIYRQFDKFNKQYGQRTGYNTPELRQQFLETKGSQIVDNLMKERGLQGNGIRNVLMDELAANIGGEEKLSLVPDYEARYAAENKSKTVNLPRTGVMGPNVPLAKEAQFEKANDVRETLLSPKINDFNKNVAGTIVNSVLTPEFIKDLGLTEQELTELNKNGGNIYKLLKGKELPSPATGSLMVDGLDPVDPGLTGSEIKAIRLSNERLDKIKRKVDNAVDMKLALDNSDFNLPITQIDPWDTKAFTAMKNAIGTKTIEDFDILNGELSTLDQKKLNDNEKYKLLKESFDIVGAGHEEDLGTVLYAKDKEGNGYLVKAKAPEVTSQMASIISDDLAKLDFGYQLDFAGNTVKYPGGVEQKLPFEVIQRNEDPVTGKRVKRYEIKGVTNESYYKPKIEATIAEMQEQGHSEAAIQQVVEPLIRNYINSKPYTTSKQGVIEYWNSLR